MRQDELIEAIDAAQRFINVASKQRVASRSDYEKRNDFAAQGMPAAATKRASMDLTRALAVIRNRSR